MLGHPPRPDEPRVPGLWRPPPVLCDASGAPLEADPGSAGAERFPFAAAPPAPSEGEENPWAVTVLDPDGAASCVLIARSPEAGGLVAGVTAEPGEYFAMLLTEGGSNTTCEDADPFTSALIDAFSSGLSEPFPWNSTFGWDEAEWGEVAEALRNRTGELFAEDGPIRNFLEDVRDQASSALSGFVNRLQRIDLEGALSGLFDLGGSDDPVEAGGTGRGGDGGGGGFLSGLFGGDSASDGNSGGDGDSGGGGGGGRRAPVLDSPDCLEQLVAAGVPAEAAAAACGS